MKRNTLNRRAFTLIELLLVLVILAVLAAVVIPKMTGRVEQAKRAGTITEISNLKNALDQFEIDNGRYPYTNEGLDALVNKPAGLDTWAAKYIDEVPVDKWGTPYQYTGPDSEGPGEFNIKSAGSDKQFGTEDDLDKNTHG